ncbi:MAG: hypothetical protein U9N48_08950 [Euryarchaeota archaeon]|nr:hypothetical protein [Euryarchaeota archaeon]
MSLLEVECPNCQQRILARVIVDVRTTAFRTGPHITHHSKVIGCYPQSVWRRENLISIYANEIRLGIYEGDDRELCIENLIMEYDLPHNIAEDIMERVMVQNDLVNTSSGLMRRENIPGKTPHILAEMPSP